MCQFTAYLGKLSGNLRLKIAKKSDERVKIMNEIISGIQVIKMYAWELPFEKVVKTIRSSEICDLTTTSYYRGTYTTCILFMERISLFITLLCYIFVGGYISSDKVFSLAPFFNIIQLGLAYYCPLAISIGAETLISIKRIRDFLMMEEKEKTSIGLSTDGCVKLEEVYANWTPTTPVLEDLTVKIQPGSLCAIIGPVGSGKSSLLQVVNF